MTQAEALAILKTGANVFLTGEPGSGKTHTINQYVSHLRSCNIEPSITASTGIAATHIGGYTIHSWSGIGIRRDLTKYDLDRIGQNRNVVRRVGNARILIIDEVSMLSARTLSMVDAVCREIRRNQQPFGGLQVILVGDFFQLPPVSGENSGNNKIIDETRDESAMFAFRSVAWETLNPLVCYLSEQHRQEDAIFLEFLSAVRRATVVESHKQLLRTRYSPKPKDGITQLYSHNADVDKINDAELLKLAGKIKTFEMESRGPEKLVVALKRGCLSPETLLLKVGARVMFTRNDIATHRYVNGTLGIISDFTSDGNPIVKTNAGKIIYAEVDEWRIEDGGRVLGRIIQFPLRLAWAMTVHKSQGMSLDAAHMDLSGTFEYGQGYVALSRVRTLAGLSLAGLNQRALEVHPEILEKDVEFRTKSERAREKFSSTNAKELATMHANFLRACGGKLGSGQVHKSDLSKAKTPTHEVTLALLKGKKTIKEIAKERGMAFSTIVNHLEELVMKNRIDHEHDFAHLEKPKRFEEMKKALEAVRDAEGKILLSLARAILGDSYSYDELRLARLFMKVRGYSRDCT
ncbi:MAG: helix-turn-helix domain-containing protein [Patescibacteria group bacterium]